MKLKLMLTSFFLAACFTAFSQEKRSGALAEKGLIKVLVMYPYAEGKTFNMVYYKSKHMPMVAGYLGTN